MILGVGRGSLGLVALLLSAATGITCGGGTPVARGFDSHQILQLRDPSLSFVGYWNPFVLYSTGAEGVGDGKIHFWAVDPATSEIREYVSLTELPPPPEPASTGRYRCSFGSSGMIIADTASGTETTITGIYVFIPPCPTDGNTTMTLWRQDDAGTVSLWTGPFDALAPVTLTPSLDIATVMRLDFANGVTDVLATRPGEPDAVGVFTIDLATLAATERVPAALGDHAWASGATDSGPLESSTLMPPGIHLRVGDHFLYWRKMTDGGTVVFAGPFASGPRELALFRIGDSTRADVISVAASDGVYASDRPVVIAFRNTDTVADTDSVDVWDDGRQRLVRCPLPGAHTLIGTRTPDGEHLLFGTQPFDPRVTADTGALGPALLVSPAAATAGDGSGACIFLATGEVNGTSLSPDGTALFWLKTPVADFDQTLWTSASDGSAQRLLGTGQISASDNHPHFIGPSQLQLMLDGDLAWLDVHDDPVRMHYIAERVFGNAIDIGRWLVTGFEHSAQDDTGRLGLVNRDTGEKRLISPEVTAFRSADIQGYNTSSSLVAVADLPIRIVYLVRGRNPSPQDGLWIATIQPSDVQ